MVKGRADFILQCGRIYKDAEIIAISRHIVKAVHDSLQCGRIYKDAEMPKRKPKRKAQNILQCGRIYKDAEINVPPAQG